MGFEFALQALPWRPLTGTLMSCRLKATLVPAASAIAPCASAQLGKPEEAPHSAACSVLIITEEATNFSLKAPFSLQKELSLTSATGDSLPHSKQESQNSF